MSGDRLDKRVDEIRNSECFAEVFKVALKLIQKI